MRNPFNLRYFSYRERTRRVLKKMARYYDVDVAIAESQPISMQARLLGHDPSIELLEKKSRKSKRFTFYFVVIVAVLVYAILMMLL